MNAFQRAIDPKSVSWYEREIRSRSWVHNFVITKKINVRLQTKLETKARRATMKCQVFELKIDKSHLSRKARNYLWRVFLEAKWFYNHCVENAFDLSTVDTRLKTVPVRTLNGIETRELSVLSSHMRQCIHQRTWTSLKSISTHKKNGDKAGQLRFKSSIDSIPFKQFDPSGTYGIDLEMNRIRLQNLKPWIKVNGLKQIPKDAEIANAHLTRKHGDFFLLVTTFSPKKKIENDRAIGMDFGCTTQMTLSNGIKIEFGVEVPRIIRKLDQKLARQRKASPKNYEKSRKYQKILAKREKLYAHITNKRKDIRNKVVSTIVNTYETVILQNESIKAWRASGHGKSISKSGIGGITAALQRRAATPILVPKWFASTQTCSACGAKRKLKIWERTYVCPVCGHVQCRDINAAVNNFQEGQKQLPAERRKPMPLEDGTSGRVVESLNRIPEVAAKLCPMKGEAAGEGHCGSS